MADCSLGIGVVIRDELSRQPYFEGDSMRHQVGKSRSTAGPENRSSIKCTTPQSVNVLITRPAA